LASDPGYIVSPRKRLAFVLSFEAGRVEVVDRFAEDAQ
jgi:hypothetical protein